MVSTLRNKEALAPVLGKAPSPQTVSRVARSLDAEVRRFYTRLLPDHYCYLLLDGSTLKVEGAIGAKNWSKLLVGLRAEQKSIMFNP